MVEVAEVEADRLVAAADMIWPSAPVSILLEVLARTLLVALEGTQRDSTSILIFVSPTCSKAQIRVSPQKCHPMLYPFCTDKRKLTSALQPPKYG